MEERLDELIQSKSWLELSDEERNFVMEKLGSEAQYDALRKVARALVYAQKADLSPDPSTLRSLQSRLKDQHRTSWSLLSYKMPAIAAMVIFILVGFTGWWVGRSSMSQIAAAEPVMPVADTDTVYVTSPADTVFVSKVVYRYVKTTVAQEKSQPISQGKPDQPESIGVSMKDKEELETLLVSGVE